MSKRLMCAALSVNFLQSSADIYNKKKGKFYIDKRREERTAGYKVQGLSRVEFVAPIYMNPKQKKRDDGRQQKRRKIHLYNDTSRQLDRELPMDSTVSYYA